jgi:hypothetical protein
VEPCASPKSEIVREISQLYFSRSVALFGVEMGVSQAVEELTLRNRSPVAQKIEVRRSNGNLLNSFRSIFLPRTGLVPSFCYFLSNYGLQERKVKP